jgi:hypothetical protein
MRKSKEVSIRQYVGAVATLNDTLKGHKELMTDHGFDPQTVTTAEFVEICECAETKEALQIRDKKSHNSDNDSSEDEDHCPKKPREKAKTSS